MNPLDAAASLAQRYLPRDQFASLREQYFALQPRLHPLMREVYGGFGSATLSGGSQFAKNLD